MKIFYSAILAILFTTAVLGQGEVPTTTDAGTTTDDSITITVTSQLTTVSTSAPTTTVEPSTTTIAPEPPTTAVTTTSSDPSTASPTTVSPTTSPTTVSPTTSIAPPTKPPTPDECTWNVTQNNITCIRAELKAIFIIPIEGRTESIVLTQNATDLQSNCSLSDNTQKLVLTENDSYSYTLTMVFAKENGNVFVNETTLKYNLHDVTDSVTSDTKIFTVKEGHSYMCKTLVDVKLGNVTMEIHDMHIQAFGGEGNSDFGAVEECDADDKVSDAVPIAVGCALAALIIIVLIAYLVGRRQSRQKGYQSV